MFRFAPTRSCLLLLAYTSAAGAGASTLADPTQPPSYRTQTTASAAPAWNLTGTLITGEQRLATINGRRVRVGDMVAGARVLEVFPTHVRLSANGREHIVRLIPRTVKHVAEENQDGR